MAKSYLVPINLNQLELQNATIQNLAAAPSSPVKGQIYFNTTTNKAMVYDGTNWVPWEANENAVTGVKGSSESTYRTGNVSISAANVGAVPTSRTVNGHALSSNVTVTASDVGLGNVTDGAEINQNAFSNVKVGSTTIAADTETDTLELTAGSNITLTPDATKDKVTIAATDTTYTSGTSTEITNGTVTNDRVWTPKILHDYVASAVGGVDAMRFKGTIGTGGDVTSLPTSGVKVGDTYRVITAGTYAGQACEIGDLIIATATTPTWTVAQTNIDGAVTDAETTGNGNAVTAISKSGNKITATKGTTFLTSHRTYTAVTGKPTENQIPSFGDTFTISQISQSTTGQISATDRTVKIPNATATSTADGLMGSGDKVLLGTLGADLSTIAHRSLTIPVGSSVGVGAETDAEYLVAYSATQSGVEVIVDAGVEDGTPYFETAENVTGSPIHVEYIVRVSQ